ncbi:MAG: poly-beta-1,6-N-acetyl-D-glucosamine synthase [Sporomusaceae bacterium]|nr:poly-beta-1,6-N-acetyl-D-glucosamine synthase [Sporomusaceae bacterium]
MRWIELLENFIFLYPLAMSIVWMIGALYFYLRREAGMPRQPPALHEHPFVSVLVPAHNEADAIAETVQTILAADYPAFEVIVIDDGSQDETPDILRRLAQQHPALRVIFLQENSGKPTALRAGALASNGEILVTIDADALIDKDAITWMVSHFVNGPRVGAVTGNPRVRNRSTLLAKIQVCEYSSIIGMIKRTQRILGKVLTVSGVIAAFRKRALYEVGFWDIDMITDDINITWKLEKRFWDIRYEPNALCWILVPETIRGLWRQRVRWSQGGTEVIRRHRDIWLDWRQRRLWPVYIEYVVSVIWSYAYVLFGIIWMLKLVFPLDLPVVVLLPDWKGAILIAVCLLQFAIGITLDSRYERYILGNYFWVIWYPFVYWLITALATFRSTPTALFRPLGRPAVWISPDRGLPAKKIAPGG